MYIQVYCISSAPYIYTVKYSTIGVPSWKRLFVWKNKICPPGSRVRGKKMPTGSRLWDEWHLFTLCDFDSNQTITVSKLKKTILRMKYGLICFWDKLMKGSEPTLWRRIIRQMMSQEPNGSDFPMLLLLLVSCNVYITICFAECSAKTSHCSLHKLSYSL